jgi:hypothetical protein
VANLNASKVDGLTASQIIASQTLGHFVVVNRAGAILASSGGVTVTHPNPGEYCIAVSGVSRATTAATVSPDYQNDSTSPPLFNVASVELDSGAPSCPAGQFEDVRYAHQHDNALQQLTDQRRPGILVRHRALTGAP